MNDMEPALESSSRTAILPEPPTAIVTPQQRTGRVLLLGNDDRVLLAVARSLGRKNIAVHLAWHHPRGVARYSRYIAATHTLPPYDPQSPSWHQALRETIERIGFDLVIPCNESSVVPLQRHRHTLAGLPGIYLLEDKVFQRTFDKPTSGRLAVELGIPVPRTLHNDGSMTAEQIIDSLGLPVMVKPRATFKNQQHAHVVRRVESAAQLRQILAGNNQDEAMLIQECFLGTGVGVELLAWQGEILTAFQHQRLHESIEYGSSYRKSVPLDTDLFDAAARLIQALNYSGVAMVEFIYNLQTRRWVFLEINGRFWGSLPLAVAAGADFPRYLYEMLIEGRREFPQEYRHEVYCRNLLLDFQGLRTRSRTNGQPRAAGFKEMAKDLGKILSGHDRLDNLTIDDPLPGVIELLRIASTAAGKVGSRLIGRAQR